MRNRSQKGFTLIELLIVIAIIGILAAVLIPNLLNARNQAQIRAVQAYSSQVFTVGNAVLASSTTVTTADVADALDTACGGAAFATVTAGDPEQTFNYGAPAAPGGVTECNVTVVGGNLNVEVVHPLVTSVNGTAP